MSALFPTYTGDMSVGEFRRKRRRLAYSLTEKRLLETMGKTPYALEGSDDIREIEFLDIGNLALGVTNRSTRLHDCKIFRLPKAYELSGDTSVPVGELVAQTTLQTDYFIDNIHSFEMGKAFAVSSYCGHIFVYDTETGMPLCAPSKQASPLFWSPRVTKAWKVQAPDQSPPPYSLYHTTIRKECSTLLALQTIRSTGIASLRMLDVRLAESEQLNRIELRDEVSLLSGSFLSEHTISLTSETAVRIYDVRMNRANEARKWLQPALSEYPGTLFTSVPVGNGHYLNRWAIPMPGDSSLDEFRLWHPDRNEIIDSWRTNGRCGQSGFDCTFDPEQRFLLHHNIRQSRGYICVKSLFDVGSASHQFEMPQNELGIRMRILDLACSIGCDKVLGTSHFDGVQLWAS